MSNHTDDGRPIGMMGGTSCSIGIADLEEADNNHATNEPTADQPSHDMTTGHSNHHLQLQHNENASNHVHGRGGLNESMAAAFSAAVDDTNETSSADAPAAKTNYKDYLRAQRSLKMRQMGRQAEIRNFGLMHPDQEEDNAGSIVGSLNEQAASRPPGASPPPSKRPSVAHHRAMSMAGRRPSLLQDSAVWQSYIHTAQAENEMGGEENPHDHHASIPWYCVPVQRQRWGDDQVLPHINWGDLFFDLFYVAAAYNLGHLLISAMNRDDWARGVVYFIGIFGHLFRAWENDLYYSSRYTVIDHFHRLFDIFRFLLVGSVVLHIKSIDLLSDSASVETLLLMISIVLESVMTIALNIELLLWADGDRVTIYNHTIRKLKYEYIPLFAVYAVSAIMAAVLYAQSRQENGGDGDGDGGHDNSVADSAYGSEGYNSTVVSDGTSRVLAAATGDVRSGYEDTSAWGVADLPYWLCCIAYILNNLSSAVRKISMSKDENKDIRKYFVPCNIDYLIHRYGEWTMLMIGESILSLLIVETVESSEYYTIAYVGGLTVIVLQTLKFESEPSHPDGHALWRNMTAAVAFSQLLQVLSMGLIVFGVSYKVMLSTLASEAHEDESDHEASSSCQGSDYAGRLLTGATGELCSEGVGAQRRLSEVPTITQQSAAAVYSASLTIVLLSLELMLTTHRGVRTNYERLFTKLEHNDWKIDYTLLVMGVAKFAIILFTATISQWQTDPVVISVLGFLIVTALAISRVVSWGLVHKEQEIKQFLRSARGNTMDAARSVLAKSQIRSSAE